MPVLAPDPDDDAPPKPKLERARDVRDELALLTPRHADNLVEALGSMSRHTALLVDVQRRVHTDGKATRVSIDQLVLSTQDLSGMIGELVKVVPTLVASNKELVESNVRLMRVLKGDKTCEDPPTPSGRRKRSG